MEATRESKLPRERFAARLSAILSYGFAGYVVLWLLLSWIPTFWLVPELKPGFTHRRHTLEGVRYEPAVVAWFEDVFPFVMSAGVIVVPIVQSLAARAARGGAPPADRAARPFEPAGVVAACIRLALVAQFSYFWCSWLLGATLSDWASRLPLPGLSYEIHVRGGIVYYVPPFLGRVIDWAIPIGFFVMVVIVASAALAERMWPSFPAATNDSEDRIWPAKDDAPAKTNR